MELTLLNFLSLYHIDATKNIKIMRHSHKNSEVIKLFNENTKILEQYQALQDKGALYCDYVVSCIAENGKTIIHDIYTVTGHRNAYQSDLPTHPLIADLLNSETLEDLEYTQLEPLKLFEGMQQRIVINWGKGALAWLQSLNSNPKPIIEIRAKGKIEEFLNYDQVLLTYHQLKDMINCPEANREWHQMLSVNGIYLISNRKTGQLYVGSAYGKDGILGRWRDYATSGHGGNVRLKNMMLHHQNAIHDMQYSILTTVASNKTAKEIINLENFYKKKLGRAAVTLNHEGSISVEVQRERHKLLLSYLKQFLLEQGIEFITNKFVDRQYFKVILNEQNILFCAFVVDDGISELLLVKQLKIGGDNIYIEISLDGKRHLVMQPWNREFIKQWHFIPDQDKTINAQPRIIDIISSKDPDYNEMVDKGQVAFGHSSDETELKEIYAQLSGSDGYYDNL